jgi:hypothetical protein
MTDDIDRWRLYFSARDSGMTYLAIAPGCAARYHHRAECCCEMFDTAFEARLFIRESNRALDAENHLPDAS